MNILPQQTCWLPGFLSPSVSFHSILNQITMKSDPVEHWSFQIYEAGGEGWRFCNENIVRRCRAGSQGVSWLKTSICSVIALSLEETPALSCCSVSAKIACAWFMMLIFTSLLSQWKAINHQIAEEIINILPKELNRTVLGFLLTFTVGFSPLSWVHCWEFWGFFFLTDWTTNKWAGHIQSAF